MPCLINHNEINYSLELNQRALIPRTDVAIAPYLRLQHKAVNLRKKFEREDSELSRLNILKDKLIFEVNQNAKKIELLKKEQVNNPNLHGDEIFELSERVGEATAGIIDCNSMIEEVLNLNDVYMKAISEANEAMIEFKHYHTLISAVYDLPEVLKYELDNGNISSDNVRALCLFFYTSEPLRGLGLTKKVA